MKIMYDFHIIIDIQWLFLENVYSLKKCFLKKNPNENLSQCRNKQWLVRIPWLVVRVDYLAQTEQIKILFSLSFWGGNGEAFMPWRERRAWLNIWMAINASPSKKNLPGFLFFDIFKMSVKSRVTTYHIDRA